MSFVRKTIKALLVFLKNLVTVRLLGLSMAEHAAIMAHLSHPVRGSYFLAAVRHRLDALKKLDGKLGLLSRLPVQILVSVEIHWSSTAPHEGSSFEQSRSDKT